MNISGIRTHAGFYDYNTIKNSEVRSQQIRDARAEELAVAQRPEVELPKEDLEVIATEQQTPRKPDQGAIEYAKQYQPDATYDLKGADSDISSLDVEKAISDMKKDQVLQQYQFFIGEQLAGDGLLELRENENFTL